MRRFRTRVGPRKALAGRVDRRIREGIRSAQRVVTLSTGAFLIPARDFDAIVRDEGVRLVVITVRAKQRGS